MASMRMLPVVFVHELLYSEPLEERVLPGREKIVAAAKSIMGEKR